MFNSTTARLGVVNPDLKPLPPNTLQCAYGQRYYRKIAAQLSSEDEVLKKKILQELLTLLKSPQNCVEAFHAGVVEVLIRGTKTPSVELRRSVVDVLQQCLLSPVGHGPFQKREALLALSQALLPLLHDEDLSIRRNVMKCIRLLAKDRASPLFLSSSGLVLDLLIQTAWKSDSSHRKEPLQSLCMFSIDEPLSTKYDGKASSSKQAENENLEGSRSSHWASATSGGMSQTKAKKGKTFNSFSDSQDAAASLSRGREETSMQPVELEEASSPPTDSKAPTTTRSFEIKKQRPSWKVLRARRVPRRQWVASVRLVRVKWGNRERTFTFYQTVTRQDTDTYTCAGSTDPVVGSAAASTVVLDSLARANDSASAAETGREQGGSNLVLLVGGNTTNPARQADCCSASAHNHEAACFNKSTSRTLTLPFSCPAPSSWKRLRPRKHPRRRWVATERAVRVKWGRNHVHLRFSVGLHQEDETATSAGMTIFSETSVGDQQSLPGNCYHKEPVEDAARPSLSRESHEICCSRGTTNPTRFTVDVLQCCGLPGNKVKTQEQPQESGSQGAPDRVDAELPWAPKGAGPAPAAGAPDKTIAEVGNVLAMSSVTTGKDLVVTTPRKRSTSGCVLLHNNTSYLRQATDFFVSVRDSLETVTEMMMNNPHAAKESMVDKMDASILLTRAAAADLAYTILSHVATDAVAARLTHVPPQVFLYIFLRSFAPAVSKDGFSSSCPFQHETLKNQSISMKKAPLKVHHQLLISCTRLVTLVCKDTFFREALVEGKLCIYVGDLLKALLEIEFLLVGANTGIKLTDGLLLDHALEGSKKDKTPSLQPKVCPNATEEGKEILKQQLEADDDKSKGRKAFFFAWFIGPSGPPDGAVPTDAAEECRGDLLALLASLSLTIEGKRQCTEHFLQLVAATCFLETNPDNLAYALQVVVNVCENPEARPKFRPLLLSRLKDMYKQMHLLMSDSRSSSADEELELCRLQRCCKRAIDAVSNSV